RPCARRDTGQPRTRANPRPRSRPWPRLASHRRAPLSTFPYWPRASRPSRHPPLPAPRPPPPPPTGIQGAVDILDAHTGLLRLRIFLPEPLATLSTDIDALHGSFLAVDENGQSIFALTTSRLPVRQLAIVPLSIGTISPASAAAAGGTTLTLRGSGFQSGATVTIDGKSAATKFVDINTLTVTTPPLTAGPQQVLI